MPYDTLPLLLGIRTPFALTPGQRVGQCQYYFAGALTGARGYSVLYASEPAPEWGELERG